MTTELQAEVERTRYVRPVSILTAVRSHGRALWKAPSRYIRTLLTVLSANVSSPLQVLKSLLHFLEAVCLGQEWTEADIKFVHVQFADTAATYAAVVYRLYEIPYSVAIHAHDIFENRYTIPLIQFRVGDARRIRVISEFNKNWLIEHAGIESEKIDVIHCGIDPNAFQRGDSPLASPPLILAVGRLVEYKGFIHLLRACRMLLDDGHAFACKIIGSGPERETLETSIQDLGLNDAVKLLGVVQHGDIRKYYEQAVIFVLPCCRASDGAMDGIPVALMEAMAMEIPVVSTKISGIPELIEDRVSGLLAPPEDHAALAQSLAMLLQDEALRSRLGRSARAKVLTNFHLEKNVAELAEMLSRTSVGLTPTERPLKIARAGGSIL